MEISQSDYMEEIRKIFVKRRLLLGISQKSISKNSGVSPATISLFEAGKVDPGTPTMIAMLNTIGLTLKVVELGVEEKEEKSISQT